MLRQKSLHIKELQEQLQNAQNSIQFENNRVKSISDELIKKNDEIQQLKQLLNSKIDD